MYQVIQTKKVSSFRNLKIMRNHVIPSSVTLTPMEHLRQATPVINNNKVISTGDTNYQKQKLSSNYMIHKQSYTYSFYHNI